jgi:hypothetical protein
MEEDIKDRLQEARAKEDELVSTVEVQRRQIELLFPMTQEEVRVLRDAERVLREQIDHLMSDIEELTKKNDSQKGQLELELATTNKRLQETKEANVLLWTQIYQLKEEAVFYE